MAAGAPGLAREQSEAALGGAADGVLGAPVVPAVEGRPAGHQGAFPGGDGGAQGLDPGAAPKRFFEKPVVIPEALDLGHQVAEGGVAHLVWGHQRSQHLGLQAGLAAVVEDGLQVGGVDHRGGIAAHGAPFDADGGGQLVHRETLLGHVAHGARDGVVAGQPPIEEELAPEGHLLRRQGIVGGHRHWRQAERRHGAPVDRARLTGGVRPQGLEGERGGQRGGQRPGDGRRGAADARHGQFPPPVSSRSRVLTSAMTSSG